MFYIAFVIFFAYASYVTHSNGINIYLCLHILKCVLNFLIISMTIGESEIKAIKTTTKNHFPEETPCHEQVPNNR